MAIEMGSCVSCGGQLYQDGGEPLACDNCLDTTTGKAAVKAAEKAEDKAEKDAEKAAEDPADNAAKAKAAKAKAAKAKAAKAKAEADKEVPAEDTVTWPTTETSTRW